MTTTEFSRCDETPDCEAYEAEREAAMADLPEGWAEEFEMVCGPQGKTIEIVGENVKITFNSLDDYRPITAEVSIPVAAMRYALAKLDSK